MSGLTSLACSLIYDELRAFSATGNKAVKYLHTALGIQSLE
jgi:hypothetical protein